MRTRRLLTRLLLAVSALVVALFGSELFVRAFVDVRDIGPALSTFDPQYRKVLKKNLDCTRRTDEFVMRFHTNSLGWRGEEPTGEAPGATVGDVVCLGDSFTLGFGVSDGEEFPALLQRDLRARLGPRAPHVTNCGIGALGNGCWLKRLRRDELPRPARLIVLQLCRNDLDDNLSEGFYRLDDHGRLIQRDAPFQATLARTLDGWLGSLPGIRDSHLLGLVRRWSGPHRSEIPPTAERTADPGIAPADLRPGLDPTPEIPGLSLTRAILAEISVQCARRGWPLLVVLADFDPALRGGMESFFHGLAIPVVALPCQREAPELYYRTDGHWNQKGHVACDTLVFQALTDPSGPFLGALTR